MKSRPGRDEYIPRKPFRIPVSLLRWRYAMRGNLCATLAASLLFAGAGLVRAEEADARKVIDKAIKAHGGAEKRAKLKASTFKMKGKFYGRSADGIDYTAEQLIQAPDKEHL